MVTRPNNKPPAVAVEPGPVERLGGSLVSPFYQGSKVYGVALLPMGDLRAIIEDAETVLIRKQAIAAAGVIVGRFPATRLHNADEFTRGLVDLLEGYHPKAVRKAVKLIPERYEFLSIASTKTVLDECQTPYNVARFTALEQIRVHEGADSEERGGRWSGVGKAMGGIVERAKRGRE